MSEHVSDRVPRDGPAARPRRATAGKPLPSSLTLDVVGLDCADCARTVERSVADLAGVHEARLHFATARLVVRMDPSRVTPADIASTVESAGYTARDPHDRLPVDGMSLRSRLGPRSVPVAAAGVALVAGLVATAAGAGEPLRAVLFGSAVVLAGAPVMRAAVAAVHAQRALDMNVLMTMAAVGAVLIGEWAEGAMAMFLFGVGNLLEGYTADRARSAIRQLMELAPPVALVRRRGRDVAVPAEEVVPGDLVVVKPGERIAVDGILVVGASTVNEAPLTGESRPIDKQPGDAVFAGTINGAGAMEVQATRYAADTTIARIVDLVESAQASRAPTQRFVDRFARVYTPIVIVTATAVAIIPPLVLGEAFATWFYRALVLLVIACPCALVISTPVSIVAAISAAARRGVLIKGGAHLEAAGGLQVMAIDKTGTLTEGRPVVTHVRPLGGHDEAQVLALAAAVESRSEHPLGRAIVHEARHRGLTVPASTAFEAIVGRGARARVGEEWVSVGPRDALSGAPDPTVAEAILADLEGAGNTAMLVTRAGEAIGVVAVADRLRDEAPEAVRHLRQAGVRRVVMLSGDNAATVRAIGARLDVDDVRASLLPEDKARAIEALVAEHGGVGMVGDGVNDAPALAAATVGIAVAGNGVAGSDAALETADVVLMSGDLTRLGYLVRLGRRTRRIVAFNIAFSLGVKAAFLVLAVAGTATLWMAVLADVGTSLLVVLNAMRLLRPEADPQGRDTTTLRVVATGT